MTTKMIYCSACDRDVEVELSEEGKLENSVCLDMGESCTGTLCPICAKPPWSQLARNRWRKPAQDRT